MTIHRVHNLITFECNNCCENFETETDDFFEARELLRENDWLIRPIDGDWFHFCSFACLKETEEKQIQKELG